MTEKELSEIEARAKVAAAHAEMPTRDWPILNEDLPALLAEVRRLRAVVEASACEQCGGTYRLPWNGGPCQHRYHDLMARPAASVESEPE